MAYGGPAQVLCRHYHLWKNIEHLHILLSGFLLSRILQPQYLFLGILKDDITILPAYENS